MARQRLTPEELQREAEFREEYKEQAWEMKANNIPVPTFREW